MHPHETSAGPAAPPTGPLVSAVVAAYNTAPTIAACIDSLLGQTYRPLELIVVDDGSTDGTAEIVERHPQRDRFHLLRLDNGGPSRARNRGCEQARGELFAFFDSDCRAAPDCVAELVRALDGPRVASAGGAQRAPAEDPPFAQDVDRFFRAIGFITDYMQDPSSGAIVDTPHNPSCNLLYRRDVFAELGGLDEGLWPGEDVDLDHRATRLDYVHRFNPRAVIEHHRPDTPRRLRRMFFAYGRAQMLLVKRYGPFRAIQLAGLAALALLPATPALVLTAPSVIRPPFAAIAITVAAIVLAYLPAIQSRRSTAVVALLSWLAGFAVEAAYPRYARRCRPGYREIHGQGARIHRHDR